MASGLAERRLPKPPKAMPGLKARSALGHCAGRMPRGRRAPRLGEPQALSDADFERFLPWSEGVPEGCRQLKKPRL